MENKKELLCKNCQTLKTLNQNHPDDPNFGRFGSKFRDKTMIEKYGNKRFNNREKAKQTCLEKSNGKYTNPGQFPEVREKMKETDKKHHGGKLFVQTQDFKDKCKKTNQDKRGVDWPTQCKEVKNKSKETCYKNYGVEYSFQSENNKNKSKITWKNNYGVDNPFKSEEIKIKIYNTNKEKYGEEHYTQTKDWKIKTIQTNLNKYGVNWFLQTEEAQKNRKPLYIYKGNNFDSKPELAYFLENENKGIIRNYDKYIEYVYDNNTHKTFPDFILNNIFIEIKGNHFLKSDGTWYYPFKNPLWSENEYIKICEIIEAKHQCLIKHNVKIIYESEILDIIKKWDSEIKKYKIKRKN